MHALGASYTCSNLYLHQRVLNLSCGASNGNRRFCYVCDEGVTLTTAWRRLHSVLLYNNEPRFGLNRFGFSGNYGIWLKSFKLS
ncbi:hypothetical protein VNO77_03205 [Canavalia gladiata]|uniref:Uncharacterized protein n=1 Tax=Canavalia gladiata TaxID=3824 RepID=A0AAN9R7X6_CANGL